MTVYDLGDIGLERDLVARAEARRQRYATMRSLATPEMAQRASALTTAYPHMPAGVVQSLTLGGVDADNPLAFQAAQMQAQVDAQDGRSFAGTGTPAPVDPGVFGRITGAGKTLIRGATTIFHGAAHELVSRPIVSAFRSDPDIFGLRNPGYTGQTFREAYKEQGDSPLFRAMDALASGADVSLYGSEDFLGTGFVPGGALTEGYNQRVQSTLIPGTNVHVTPGRSMADLVTEPGTRAFDILSGAIDFSLSVFADPTAKVGGALGKARKAERTFGAAGMTLAEQVRTAGGIRASRRTVASDVASNWLDTNPLAQRLVDNLAKTDDFTTVWTNLGRKTIGRKLALEIADEADPAAVREILRRELGTTIRSKPTGTAVSRGVGTALGAVGDTLAHGRRASADSATRAGEMFGVGAAFRQSFAGSRAFQMMPKGSLSIRNLDDAQVTLDRFMRTAKLSDDEVRGFHRRFAEIDEADPGRAAAMRGVVIDVLKATDTRLQDRGRSADFAKRMTRMLGDDFEEDLRIYYQEFGDDVIFEGTKVRQEVVDGQVVTKARPTAQLLTEYTDFVPLTDDIREFRRATGMFANLWESDGKLAGGIKMTARGWDALMARWSQSQLLRIAWPVRVTLEGQARFAAEGLDGAYNHPLRFIMWSFGHRGDVDILGDPIKAAKQFHAGLGKRGNASAMLGRHRQAQAWFDVHKGVAPNSQFVKSWVGEMSLLWGDDIAARLAGGLRQGDTLGDMQATGNLVDDVTNWLVHGNGRSTLEELATADGKRHFLTDPEAVRRYVGGGTSPDGQTVKGVVDRLMYQTGGRRELLDAIGSGKINGTDLTMMSYDRGKVYKAFGQYLDDAPTTVKGVKDFGQGVADRAVDRIFEVLFTVQDNTLNRIPGFKQNYWRRVGELIGEADAATQKAIIKRAGQAKLDGLSLEDLRVRSQGGAAGKIGIEELDHLAKDFALEQTRKLLYDVTERSNFAEGSRFVTAFAEAWKEIAQTWVRLGAENPQVGRRVQQLVETARETGFLYPDPQTGEERFAYPGGGALATVVMRMLGMPQDATPGVSAALQLEGNARSLNLFSSTVIPGLGPVTTLALGEWLPDKPEYKDLRSMLLPYGGEDVEGVGGAVEHFMPSWWKKLTSGVFGDRAGVDDALWMSTNADMANYLVANGDYVDQAGMLDEQRLAADAKKLSHGLLIFRGLAQGVLPASPQAEVFLQPEDGGAQIHFFALGEELRRLQDEHGFEEGLNKFLGEFGVEALMATVPRSQTIRKRAMSKPGSAWEKANPDLVAAHPDVAGYFAPESPDDFDVTAWGSAIDAGDLIRLDDRQRIALNNRMVAFWLLDQAERKAAQHPDQTAADAWVSQIRQGLESQYPGVFDRVGVASGMEAEQKINALALAVQEPRLAETEAGQALALYLQARDKAQASVPQFSSTATGWASAKSTKPIRDWLRQVGEGLALQYQDFAPMWNEVFQREGLMSPEKEYPDVDTEGEVA